MRGARAFWGCAALLACLAAQAVWSSRVHSNAYDELAYVGAGYSYAKTGNFALDAAEHPPLLKLLSGLCLLPSSPPLPASDGNAYRFGRDLLYQPGVDPLALLFKARLPSLLLALALGLAVFLSARWRFGDGPALAAAALLCFEPLVVAHASFLSLDLGVAALGFIAWELLERDRPVWGGAVLAAALATKISAALLIPAAFLTFPRRMRRTNDWAAVALLGSSAALFLAGAPSLVALVAGRVQQLTTSVQGTNYLLGQARAGWFPSYYAVAFLVKSTLPFLLLLALAARGKGSDKRLLIVPAFFLAAGTLSHKQLGIRYLLPAYPFLCVYTAAAFERRRAWPAIALVAWHAAECLAFAPRTLPYFNELAGGRDGGHRVLADSNLDWGMELPLLSRYLKEKGPAEIITAVASDGDLDYWLGPHQDLLPDPLTARRPFERVGSKAPAREFLVVSAGYKVGFGLSEPKAFAWLDRLHPVALLAGSILVYDVTADAWAHNKLGGLYLAQGKLALALRECERALEIEPRNPGARAAYEQVARLYRGGR